MDDSWPTFMALMQNVYWAMLPCEICFSSETPLCRETVARVMELLSYLLAKLQLIRASSSIWELGDEHDSDERGNGGGRIRCDDMITRKGCTSHGAMGEGGMDTMVTIQ